MADEQKSHKSTIRFTPERYEQMRSASYQSKWTFQQIIETALDSYLAGFHGVVTPVPIDPSAALRSSVSSNTLDPIREELRGHLAAALALLEGHGGKAAASGKAVKTELAQAKADADASAKELGKARKSNRGGRA